MSVKLGKITHINNFDGLDIDFSKVKNILKDVGVINSTVYFDEKSGSMFSYLEILDYEKYIIISKGYTDEWWANLKPIKDITIDETAVDYAWHDVFKIKDND